MEEKINELKEKYADVINDLATKYEKDVGIGFDMLIAIARGNKEGLKPLYTTDIELDMEELAKDYEEYAKLSNEKKIV